MNRQWAAFFGRGLVRTTEDFGYQGEPPATPSCSTGSPSSCPGKAGQ